MSWFTKKVPAVVTQERGAAVEVEQVGWISVRDKIPEFGIRVLVSCTEYGVLCGRRETETASGSQWKLGMREPPSIYSIYPYFSEASSKTVTHWMPLPPGPKP